MLTKRKCQFLYSNHPCLVLPNSFKELICMGIMNDNLRISVLPVFRSNSLNHHKQIQVSSDQNPYVTFHDTGWLIGILIMANNNPNILFNWVPYITQPTGVLIRDIYTAIPQPVTLARKLGSCRQIWLRKPRGR